MRQSQGSARRRTRRRRARKEHAVDARATRAGDLAKTPSRRHLPVRVGGGRAEVSDTSKGRGPVIDVAGYLSLVLISSARRDWDTLNPEFSVYRYRGPRSTTRRI